MDWRSGSGQAVGQQSKPAYPSWHQVMTADKAEVRGFIWVEVKSKAEADLWDRAAHGLVERVLALREKLNGPADH